jgi:hypothetical protein
LNLLLSGLSGLGGLGRTALHNLLVVFATPPISPVCRREVNNPARDNHEENKGHHGQNAKGLCFKGGFHS